MEANIRRHPMPPEITGRGARPRRPCMNDHGALARRTAPVVKWYVIWKPAVAHE